MMMAGFVRPFARVTAGPQCSLWQSRRIVILSLRPSRGLSTSGSFPEICLSNADLVRRNIRYLSTKKNGRRNVAKAKRSSSKGRPSLISTLPKPDNIHVSKKRNFCLGDRVSLVGTELIGKVVRLPLSEASDVYKLEVDGQDLTVNARSQEMNLCFNVDDQVRVLGSEPQTFGIVLDTDYVNGTCSILVEGANNPTTILIDKLVLVERQMSTKQQLGLRRMRTQVFSKDQKKCAKWKYRLENMMEALKDKDNQIKAFGREFEPLPDLRAEILHQEGGLPEGVDFEWANDFLQEVYQLNFFLPHAEEADLEKNNFNPSHKDVISRFGRVPTLEELAWFTSKRRPGDINPWRSTTSYDPHIRHSFSNQAYRCEELYLGTVHVAVGFVDLGVLFAARLLWGESQMDHRPLRFIGIDKSPFAVAKTLVIWEMLKQTRDLVDDDHLSQIMQVWFSSTWSQGTEEAVKAAISTILESSTRNCIHEDVKSFLEHWLSVKTMPLYEARTQHSEHAFSFTSFIPRLVRKKDRIAIGNYELTGDFGLKGRPIAGNTIMFDCPDGSAPRADHESVFSALEWEGIFEILSTSDCTVIEAAEQFALSHVRQLAALALLGCVTVELRCCSVEESVDDIASLKPRSMSWSNVVDYCDYEDFHRIARTCSNDGKTIHFGYTMNWGCHAFGVGLLDYGEGDDGAKIRSRVIKLGNEALAELYKGEGWDTFLRLPVPTSPESTTRWLLGQGLHRKWTDNFFEIGRRIDSNCDMLDCEHAAAVPLSSSGLWTVFFTWTYQRRSGFVEEMEDCLEAILMHLLRKK